MFSQQQIQTLIKKYGGAVPRYTSYPTAVQFTHHFTSNDHTNALRTLNPEERVSLYIHIPFCQKLCHYCGCHTRVTNHESTISTYVETLCQEIRLISKITRYPIKVSSIHFGGGTPNYAPIADLKKILATAADAFSFLPNVKINMECDPRLLHAGQIEELAKLGISRVSLGIQDFDAKVQQAINRIQPLEHVRTQVTNLRKSGIKEINFDLITGLPEQTEQTLAQTLTETLKIRPPRIAVFAYAHVPWFKKHQKLLERYRLPSAEERFFMQKQVHDRLAENGYMAVGIDHYALPTDALAQSNTKLQRNFQGYTDDDGDVVLGFGASAISQFANSYAQNTTNWQDYRNAIEVGKLATTRGIELTRADKQVRKAIMELMCTSRLNLDIYNDLFENKKQLAEMESDNLLIRKENTLEITERGKPFTRVIAACFDTYFQAAKQQPAPQQSHARAI